MERTTKSRFKTEKIYISCGFSAVIYIPSINCPKYALTFDYIFPICDNKLMTIKLREKFFHVLYILLIYIPIRGLAGTR